MTDFFFFILNLFFSRFDHPRVVVLGSDFSLTLPSPGHGAELISNTWVWSCGWVHNSGTPFKEMTCAHQKKMKNSKGKCDFFFSTSHHHFKPHYSNTSQRHLRHHSFYLSYQSPPTTWYDFFITALGCIYSFASAWAISSPIHPHTSSLSSITFSLFHSILKNWNMNHFLSSHAFTASLQWQQQIQTNLLCTFSWKKNNENVYIPIALFRIILKLLYPSEYITKTPKTLNQPLVSEHFLCFNKSNHSSSLFLRPSHTTSPDTPLLANN